MESVILDELDRQLAHALQVDGRASFSQIAAVLGTSDRTIARRYQRLRSTGTLRVVGLPDAAALGHVDWLVRMRCTPDVAGPVSAALARRADTSWVSLLSGGTEITCITRTRQQTQDGDLLLQKLPRTSRITSVTAHCMLRPVAGTSGWPGRTAALSPAQIAALQPSYAPPLPAVTAQPDTPPTTATRQPDTSPPTSTLRLEAPIPTPSLQADAPTPTSRLRLDAPLPNCGLQLDAPLSNRGLRPDGPLPAAAPTPLHEDDGVTGPQPPTRLSTEPPTRAADARTSPTRPDGPLVLTAADNALLGVLAQDGRATYPTLAAATGWSETTVRRRLEELRRNNVLYFDVEIEPALFGYTAEAMLWLTVVPSALTTVTQALATHPEIGYASAVTGPANVAASVICRNLNDLYEYLATGVGSLTGITHADTSPLVRRVKAAGLQ